MPTLHNRQRWQTRRDAHDADATDADLGPNRDDLSVADGMFRALLWMLLLWAAGALLLLAVLGA